MLEEKNVPSIDHEDKAWPEIDNGCFSRWTYSYINPLLSRGARKTLSKDDLWNVPPSLRSPTLLKEFNSLPSDLSLLRKLWMIASPCFLPAGFFQFVTVICQCSIPLLGRQLIRLIENKPENFMQQGIGYAFLIFSVTSINGIANQRQLFLSMQSGMMVRTAVVSAVYSTSLKLNPRGKLGITSGQVTNLVAVDSQKLFEIVQDGHLIWSCPLSMIVVMALLILVQGPVTIFGMLVLILMVPLVKLIVSLMQNARKARVKHSDVRIQTTTAMINGIQVTKLNSYEEKFEKKISEKRRLEMKYLRKELFIWGWTLIFTVVTPIFATGVTFMIYVIIDEANILTASDTFTTLMLFSALRFPINLSGRLVGRLGQSLQACERISDFLSRETHKDHTDVHGIDEYDTDKAKVVKVENGTFRVLADENEANGEKDGAASNQGSTFSLTNMNFSLCRGEILAVIGSVGSGKSTLANALVGEIPVLHKKSLNVLGKVGYSSQIPFILNATLRENILFGNTFNPDRYYQVLNACCLNADIELLSSGDLTEIGERGVTLSGGQKQRLSIARTVYAKPDVAIFDDPLSALDAGTSRIVCERLFLSKNKYDLLSSTAVILVTHATYFLHQMDQILVLENGTELFLGSYDDLMSSEEAHANDFVRSLTHDVQENSIIKNDDDTAFESQKHGTQESKITAKSTSVGLMTNEEREFGIASFYTWKVWFNGAGGWMFAIFQVLLLGIDRSAYVLTEWWLAKWTEAAQEPIIILGIEFPSQLDGRSAQVHYIVVYAIIICVSFIGTVLRTTWAVMGGARCAEKLFEKMTMTVLRAPMSYFHTNPLGRILNRFTYDVEVLDVQLSQNMSITIIALSWYVAAVAVLVTILPWLILVLIPITLSYIMVQLHYRKSSVDIQRLDAISRSPLQTMLSEVMDGAITIRVFDKEENFRRKFFHCMDSNNAAMLTFIAAHKWLGVHLEVISGIVIFFVILLVSVMQQKSRIEPGLAALLIIWSTNLTIIMGYIMDSTSESEAAITSVERINAMSTLPQEKSISPNGEKVPPNWPRSGSLMFKQVYMRYRKDLPYALKGLSLELPSGKRCGVVGRTGAGKSSLAVALFRLVEIESGQIFLDDVDLSQLNLSQIRGRSGCMSIIPQDPVLFSGSIRDCLDPFNEWSNDVILEALDAVRLLKQGRGIDSLEDPVAESGSNFSVGERQLLCMARALLAKPKFLVLDEATASVDGETDKFIQEMLRTRFKGCTLLTIAHRLNTIMDYDLIIAMDDGKVAEFDSPSKLLQDKNGVLSHLVDATGEESANALRAMVKR